MATLSKIKLSGFKSFVDPTSLILLSNLVAVVGPNGCGKSNIFDAVSWVMGESSPKYLRGESSTDVIFNGSSARKPVGLASVELIFDNQRGLIGGEYASFAEVSIKRVITREGDSSYFLNGVRCRKRDMRDIFLGTGLGPRSYSIVGQNMISKMVEAKPEELRTYLEEAAGISKYKERRRETELRIQHTKENLARINDVRTELEKQLNTLKHQANAAERFKTLKQQERILKAEWYAIQWRNLDSKIVDATLKIQRGETTLEARHLELSEVDQELEQFRNEQRTSQDALQEVQRQYYAVGNEITRLEQAILHHQEKQQQWETDLNQAQMDWQTVQTQLSETEENLSQIEIDIETIDPKLIESRQHVHLLQDELTTAEENLQSMQIEWDEFNQTSAKTMQTAQVEQTHIQHHEQKIIFLQKRQTQLQEEKNRFNFEELNQELETFTLQAHELTEILESHENELAAVRDQIQSLQSEQLESNANLDKVRSELQRLRGQQASLEALQQTALGQKNNPSADWVARHQLENRSRLAKNIQVEKGWEAAVEKVLGFCLQAVCVDELNEVLPHLESFKSGNLCIVALAKNNIETLSSQHDLLLEKIQSPFPLQSLLSGIHAAESVDEALKLLESLPYHESVVTRDGIWMNKSWLKILREHDPAAGVFQREQELKALAERIDELQETQAVLQEQIQERREKIMQLEQQRDQVQQTLNQHQARSAQIHAQEKTKKERLVELKMQSQRFVSELEECNAQLQTTQSELVQAKELWQQAMAKLEHQAEQREKIINNRDLSRQALQSIRDKMNQHKESLHQLEMQIQTAKSQKSTWRENAGRMQSQLSVLSERKNALEKELSSMSSVEALKKSLSQVLDKHAHVETELNHARVAVESLNQEFAHLEDKRQIIEADINKIRTSLETLRMEWQGWKVKSETLLEQMTETQFALEEVLQSIPEGALPDDWQMKCEQVAQRIHRLGPINLIAIEEYATCLERKEYLDRQLEDLQASMATLEDAIAKIDKETRAKFKDTFETVNSHFQALFPTIFGGGKASLELTDDNLLESGVTVMASPPGKRNSTIHLLSGGEKTLTAIALIFSIFQLNPAPFCLLDEVDAALDDANVIRFCKLVKVMAEKTQFLFVSHNKITIETANQLMGVTMNEPGVSRLVSVDMEKALSLAEE